MSDDAFQPTLDDWRCMAPEFTYAKWDALRAKLVQADVVNGRLVRRIKQAEAERDTWKQTEAETREIAEEQCARFDADLAAVGALLLQSRYRMLRAMSQPDEFKRNAILDKGQARIDAHLGGAHHETGGGA